MTGEGFMGVTWREDEGGIAVCSPCGIAVVWAGEHEALSGRNETRRIGQPWDDRRLRRASLQG
jgi:hypothetical protein